MGLRSTGVVREGAVCVRREGVHFEGPVEGPITLFSGFVGAVDISPSSATFRVPLVNEVDLAVLLFDDDGSIGVRVREGGATVTVADEVSDGMGVVLVLAKSK